MAVSLALVGVCSFAFHATLRQGPQFSDDISMLYLAGSLIQRLYCSKLSSSSSAFATAVIFAAVTGLAAFYVQSGNLLLHTGIFAGELTLVWPRTLYLIYGQNRSDAERSRHLWNFLKAVAYLVLGFVLWNIDLNYCQELRDLRKSVGIPSAWVLELHGWWHFLTALGAFEYMKLIRSLCQ
jgi:dihydroceramidase